VKYLIALIIMVGCTPLSYAEGEGIQVTDAWVRPVILLNRPGAAYFTLNNGSGRADKLIRVSSPWVNRIEMHENTKAGGIMRMRQVKDIPVGAGDTVLVEPGGIHLMLFGLQKKLAVGDDLILILTFVHAGDIEIRAKVRKRAP